MFNPTEKYFSLKTTFECSTIKSINLDTPGVLLFSLNSRKTKEIFPKRFQTPNTFLKIFSSMKISLSLESIKFSVLFFFKVYCPSFFKYNLLKKTFLIFGS